MSKPSYVVYTKDFANMVCRRLKRENKNKDKEIKRLHSIIKEVREYIKSRQNTLYEIRTSKILEILDKENKENEQSNNL